MGREFKKGEKIFNYDWQEKDLHGFGEVLMDAETNYEDSIVLIKANHSGEIEAQAEMVYKVAENRICRKCGCVVCHEHYKTFEDIPYFCPSCDEGMFDFETTELGINQFAEAFRKSEKIFIEEITSSNY